MPVPSLRFSLRRIAAVAALLLIGLAVWFFLIRDEGSDSVAAEKAGKEKAERERVSDDPLVREMSVAEQAEQVLMLGFEGTAPDAPAVAELSGYDLGAVIVGTENWAGLDRREEAGRRAFCGRRNSTDDRHIAGGRHLQGSCRTCPPKCAHST